MVYHTMHTWITRSVYLMCVRYETTLDGTHQKWPRVDPVGTYFGPLKTPFGAQDLLLRTLFWSGSDRPRGRK